MDTQKLYDYYLQRGLGETAAANATKYLEDFGDLHSATRETLRHYLDTLISKGENSEDRLLALARYCYVAGLNDHYVYFTSLFGGRGVMETIEGRLKGLAGEGAARAVFNDVIQPPLGTDLIDFPAYTQAIVEKMIDLLPGDLCHQALAGNNHRIPPEAFFEEKKHYEAAPSLDAYLADYQRRQIEILQTHCDQNKVWFEQTITQAVVDFAASNQEIMSAVRQGNWLYTTKIPYDPDRYLKTTDPQEKRYLACHCPFVREAIRATTPKISDQWCSCSAGFSKHPYEVILGRPLEVETVASVLKGDDICRFRIFIGDRGSAKA